MTELPFARIIVLAAALVMAAGIAGGRGADWENFHAGATGKKALWS
jgi:hypothetical protein